MQNTSEFYTADAVCPGKAVSFRAVIAGAIAAVSASAVLTALGAGIGLAFMSPYAGDESTVAAFTVKLGIWIIVMQWISAALGGYIAGRLRTKWTNIHADECHFRDTAHGFLAWAVATIFVAIAVAGTGASAFGGAAKMAGMHGPRGNMQVDYYVGTLYRGGNGPERDALRRDAVGIFTTGFAKNELSDADRGYLVSSVARSTGVSQSEAAARVDKTVADITAFKDEARKAGSGFAIFNALAMMVGAFIAAVAAACGGCHRDGVTVCRKD